jgi:hypothetical protein
MSYLLFFIADCKNSFPFDIVFINDESSSITPTDFYTSLQTMADIVNKFTIGENNVRVALVAFNELARTVFNFNTSFVKSEINSTILGTTQSSGSTNDSDILNALNYTCSNVLNNVNAGDRSGVINFIVLITASQSRYENIETIRMQCQTEKTVIYTIGVGNNTNSRFLQFLAPTLSLIYNTYDEMNSVFPNLFYERLCLITGNIRLALLIH